MRNLVTLACRSIRIVPVDPTTRSRAPRRALSGPSRTHRRRGAARHIQVRNTPTGLHVSRVYYTDVLHGTTVISRDDSRASKVIRLIRYQRNEHASPSCSLKCKTFSYRYARSRDTFFSKQVPYQGRPREGKRGTELGWVCQG